MSAVSQSHIAHVPFSRTKRAYSVTSRPFNTCGHDATSDPSGWLVILAVLNSGCGDGAGEAAHEDDVDITPQLNWLAMLAMSTSRVGPVGEEEQAHATMRAHTDINPRTMTSHQHGGSCSHQEHFRCRANCSCVIPVRNRRVYEAGGNRQVNSSRRSSVRCRFHITRTRLQRQSDRADGDGAGAADHNRRETP